MRIVAEGWDVVEACADVARRRLGSRLSAVFAIGSLAHGGFSAWASDVDVVLLTDGEDGLAEEADAIAAAVRAGGPGPLAERLSLFHAPWARLADPPPGARMPAIDRLDLLDHGVLVWGVDERARHAARPSRQAIADEAITFAANLLDPAALRDVAHDPTGLVALGARAASKVVLWPVRLLHVVETGQVAANADAVAHHGRSGLPGGALAAAALAWRADDIVDRAAAERLLAEELIALHIGILERVIADGGAALGPLAAALRGSGP